MAYDRKPLTKAQAERIFKSEVLPSVIEKHGAKDKAAVREAWNNFTDYLQKNLSITADQYNNWQHPRWIR